MGDQPTLEQMRAFLMSQGVFPQSEVYDDGASLLGQNPDMQNVGFKVPKVPKIFDIPHDPGRRSMGLTLPKQSNLPVPGQQSPFAQALAKERGTDTAPVVQEAPTQQPPNISPLEYAAEAIKNLPMTRRQVLQTPLNAAVSHYGRQLLGPISEAAPIAEAAPIVPQVAEAAFIRNPVLDAFLQDYASTFLFDSAVNVPYASLDAYDLMRDYLKGRVPEKTLNKYEEIYNRARNNQDEEGELNEDGFKALDEIEKIVDKNLKHLNPNELQNMIENMQQHEAMPDEFATDVLTNLSNSGEEDSTKHYKDLVKYIEDSWSHKAPK